MININNAKSIEDCLEVDLNRFTVFVFSPDLTNGLAREYIENHKNTPSYIDNKNSAKRFIDNIFNIIENYIQPIANIIAPFFSVSSGTPVIYNSYDYIYYSTQLLTTQDHKAASLDRIDPIILVKKNLSANFLNKLSNIFYSSPLKPKIIILENNDSIIISEQYKNFPTNTLIKYIDNSLNVTESVIINKGADNYDTFINCMADRCFDTCASTDIKLLINKDIFNENIINKYTVPLLKIHTNLLYDRKEIIKNELTGIINDLEKQLIKPDKDEILIKSYLCMALINRVFCNDYGGNDICKAFELSNDLDNEILKSHINRYCDFLPNISPVEKSNQFKAAEKTFKNNKMLDHAFYCRNNNFVDSFSTNKVDSTKFTNLVHEAKKSVPGMCGLIHIINNAGVALLYERKYYDAINLFDDGISRITNIDRIVQKCALKINKMIAEFCISCQSPKKEFICIMNEIKYYIDKNLYFIKARYYMNLVSMAFQYDKSFGIYLIKEYDVANLVNKCIKENKIGALQLQYQLKFLEYYSGFPKELFEVASSITSCSGKRMEFICTKGLNPFHFKTWL